MDNTGKRHAQRQVFAIVRALESKLQSADLSVSALWEWVLNDHGISSRSELTEKQWVVLSAKLFAAQRHSQLFESLCKYIRKSVNTCRVYRRQTNGKFVRVYHGVVTDDITLRCQKHADAAGCNVELHNADGEDGLRVFKPIEYKYDTPPPPIAPVDRTTPARIFEIRVNGNTTQHVEIMFPNTPRLRDWCHRYVIDHGVDIVVTDQLGHYELMKFTINKKDKDAVTRP